MDFLLNLNGSLPLTTTISRSSGAPHGSPAMKGFHRECRPTNGVLHTFLLSYTEQTRSLEVDDVHAACQHDCLLVTRLLTNLFRGSQTETFQSCLFFLFDKTNWLSQNVMSQTCDNLQTLHVITIQMCRSRMGHLAWDVMSWTGRPREDRVESFPPLGGFPPIFHGFLTPLRSVQIWGESRPICRGVCLL